MSTNLPNVEASIRRRLEDRYVMFADVALRSRYLGRSEGRLHRMGAFATSILLRTWRVVKGWPFVGPTVYGAYRRIRGLLQP
jgi:hypothetical protein